MMQMQQGSAGTYWEHDLGGLAGTQQGRFPAGMGTGDREQVLTSGR